MKIKEINLQRYGPLESIHWMLNDGIQPIYGPNQSGKTLLIEALLEMFTGREYPLPEGMNRVDEFPEGFIIIEEEGREEKITGENSLCEMIDIEQENLINTLVVRNTDLQIHNEDKFYGKVTDKLTGLWVNSIQKIDEELRELGRLTETRLSLSDKERFHYAKSQRKNAIELKQEVEEYLSKASAEAISSLEARKLKFQERKKQLENKITALKLSKWSDFCAEARDSLSNLHELPSSTSISALEKKLEDGERSLRKLPFYRNLRDFAKHLSTLTIIGSLTISTIFLLGLTLFQLPLLFGTYVIPLSFFGGLGSAMGLYSLSNLKLTKAQNTITTIVKKAQRCGYTVQRVNEKGELSGVKEWLNNIQRKRRECENNLSGKVAILKDDLKLNDDLSQEETLNKARQKIEEKEQEVSLKDVHYSQEKLEKVNTKLSNIEQSLKNVLDKLRKHDQKLRDFQKKTNELNFQTLLGEGLNIYLENIDALKKLKGKLEQFIEKIEQDEESAKVAVEIFRVLKSEEEEKISELFGGESKISQFFADITQGKYNDVEYDHKNEEIFVTSSEGVKRYPSRELCGSRGTIGQLYLSVRIGLSQMLLNRGRENEENAAFFILDDAFTFSDPERKERQYKLMKKLSRTGWQILYLTSDPRIAEELEERSGNDILNLTKTYV